MRQPRQSSCEAERLAQDVLSKAGQESGRAIPVEKLTREPECWAFATKARHRKHRRISMYLL